MVPADCEYSRVFFLRRGKAEVFLMLKSVGSKDRQTLLDALLRDGNRFSLRGARGRGLPLAWNLLCTREGPERGAKTGGRYVGRNTLNTTNQIVTSILDNPGAILLLNWDIPRSLRLQQIKLAANCFN